MFEKKKIFSWKMPVLAVLSVMVILIGVAIGVQIKDTQVARESQREISNSKEVFQLNKDCEIWVQGQITSSGSYESPKMLGIIPKDLLNKSKDEIVSYLSEKYPNKDVVSMNQYEIILCNDLDQEPAKASKYSIEAKDGFIHVYKYDKKGNKTELEKTEISVESLPKSVQEELSTGILVDSEDDAYGRLENFES